jgi:hypothetical protein
VCTCRCKGFFTAAVLQEVRDAKAASCPSLQGVQAVGLDSMKIYRDQALIECKVYYENGPSLRLDR